MDDDEVYDLYDLVYGGAMFYGLLCYPGWEDLLPPELIAIIRAHNADVWAPRSKAPNIARCLIMDGVEPSIAVQAADLLAE